MVFIVLKFRKIKEKLASMPFRWANLRRVIGRSPQSVTDYDVENLRYDESMQNEVPGVLSETTTPTLPVNVAGVTGFQNLPDELLEQVFLKLSGSSRKNYFAVSGVSRAWRRLGNKMFFSSPWDNPHLICHPNQLFCLSPRTPTGSRSGLLKCFIRRDPLGHTFPDGRTGRKLSFFLGKDPMSTTRARFLLTAVQSSRYQTLIFLNSKCEGPPCARLVGNFLCTSYSLENGMSFVLEGPNISINGGSNANFYNRSGGTGGSTLPARTGPAVNSGLDESTNNSSHPEQNYLPSVSSPCSSPVIPPLLMSLRYRARVRGLMQPRRMDAALPNPSFMACGALPKMQRADSVTGGSGDGGTATSGPSTGMWLRRPSLGYISSVAALERPLAPCEDTTVVVVGDDSGAGPSNSTPNSSAYTSLEASPENPLPLGAPTSQSSGAVASAAAAQNNAAAVPSPAAAATAAVPLWKHALGFDRLRPAAQRTNATPATGNRGADNFNLLRARRGATFDESALPVCLVNKSPHWNEALRCWCLNFRGRVKLASVKNFQLVKDGDEEAKVSMQFGKFGKDLFILDFNPMTLSAVQAFAIALTTFDSKVTL